MIPHLGEYVILQIDPVASLAGLDDPKATEACKALMFRKYVACVTWIVPPFHGAEYISVSFTLVSIGIGDGVPAKFLLPEMSIPIHPNTSHPLSRPSLMPSKNLPWKRCYQSTQLGSEVRCKNSHILGMPWPPAKYELPAQESVRLQMLSSEDGNWRRRLFSDAQAAKHISENKDKDKDDSTDAPQSSDNGTGVHVPCTKISVISRLWQALVGRAIRLFDNDGSSICSEDEGGMYLFGPPPSDIFSNDLTFLPAEEIGDPFMFYDELKALKRIEEDLHEQIKRTVEKTRELDDALYDKLMSKARASSPVAESIFSGMYT
ncbi:hypothetical protein IW262DRAFT_1505767 [Armillaria fumosa]|nr:hypothetical protein IW262DRAFT_1505767 [Armillaria fumosa]